MTTHYDIAVEEREYTIRAIDPTDSWDAGDYGLEATPRGLYNGEGKASGWTVESVSTYDTIYGRDDIAPGELAYVVFVRYTTGSTFGFHGAWTVAAILRDKGAADKAAERVKGPNETTRGYRKWDGYFESLDEVTVYSMVVI